MQGLQVKGSRGAGECFDKVMSVVGVSHDEASEGFFVVGVFLL